MSHRKEAPLVTFVEGEDRKTFRRKLKELAEIRLTYGKSTFFDSTTYEPHYPIKIIGPTLIEAVRKARACGEELELSVPELRLWCQMFPSTSRTRQVSV